MPATIDEAPRDAVATEVEPSTRKLLGKQSPAEPKTASTWWRRVRRVLEALVFAAIAFVMWPVGLGGATNYTVVSGHSMEPTYHTGDLVVTRRSANPQIGDVIVYGVPKGDPGEGGHVIHRVTAGDAVDGYVTQGDHNDSADPWHPKRDNIVGVVVFLVPQGGRDMLMALSPFSFGIVFVGFFLWVMWPRTAEELAAQGDVLQSEDLSKTDGEPGP